jgi:hypothetical protein
MSPRSVSSSLSRSGDWYFLSCHLHVVALQEERTAEALAQRRGGHDGGVFVRPLLGVADFRPRDLEDEGAGVEALGGAHHRAARVVGHHPHVDGRHGEAAGLTLAHRDVEVVDRGEADPLMGRQMQDDPAGRALHLGRRAEDRGVRQTVHEVRGRRGRDRDLVSADGGDTGEGGGEVGN